MNKAKMIFVNFGNKFAEFYKINQKKRLQI